MEAGDGTGGRQTAEILLNNAQLLRVVSLAPQVEPNAVMDHNARWPIARGGFAGVAASQTPRVR